jgi:hypothetical protein
MVVVLTPNLASSARKLSPPVSKTTHTLPHPPIKRTERERERERQTKLKTAFYGTREQLERGRSFNVDTTQMN